MKKLALASALALALIMPAAATQFQRGGTLGQGDATLGVVVEDGNGNKGLPAIIGVANMATMQAAPTTSATLLVAARSGAPGVGRIAATLYNFGAVTVYVGVSGVTSANGIPLAPNASFTIPSTVALYGVTASGNGAIAIAEYY